MSNELLMVGGVLINRNIIISILFILLLFGCSNKISKEEAEDIVLTQAKLDGYTSPVIWRNADLPTDLCYLYSEKHDKDMKVWRVQIATTGVNSENNLMYDAVYYISEENGEIIEPIN